MYILKKVFDEIWIVQRFQIWPLPNLGKVPSPLQIIVSLLGNRLFWLSVSNRGNKYSCTPGTPTILSKTLFDNSMSLFGEYSRASLGGSFLTH